MTEKELSKDTVSFYTLGCKVNQVETEMWRETFSRLGYQEVRFPQKADIYVVNTCKVTQTADKKSRAALARARRANDQAKVIATGCYADIAWKEGRALPGVDLVVPNEVKEYLAEITDAFIRGKEIPGYDREKKILRAVEYQKKHHRTRAFVKIQDGCESFCSYCIVPYARGTVRSKSPDDVLREIENLLALDYKEIVLTGIHLGQYGKDFEGWDLSRLLTVIVDAIPGEYRLRLGSLEPREVGPELIEVMGNPHLCRHLHIPLQSGSDEVLSRMHRNYTGTFYAELVQRLVERIPGIAVTADVMVGFPGEGEKEFQDTLRLIQLLPLAGLHVFKYSPRPGTKAFHMSEAASYHEMEKRSKVLIAMGKIKKKEFVSSLEGVELLVLTEERNQMVVRGWSDNYVEVNMPLETELNRFYRVVGRSEDGEKLEAVKYWPGSVAKERP